MDRTHELEKKKRSPDESLGTLKAGFSLIYLMQQKLKQPHIDIVRMARSSSIIQCYARKFPASKLLK